MSLSKKELIKQKALADLESFIRLVHPQRVLGHCHKDLLMWWAREEGKSHQLVLLPRDHQKSALAAYRVAWAITKDPTLRVLYISSTANLAYKQLKFIKDILTCDKYREYWPEMVNSDESRREKWTESEISVDHPARKEAIVRDPTIFTAGLTTNIVGLHCDIAVLDDVVVGDSAYTEEGREKCRTQVGYLASIGSTECLYWAVGTRYHPKDLYNDFSQQKLEEVNDDGEIVHEEQIWDWYEKQVEDAGDGSGNFLWPRLDNSKFGFNRRILALKRASYPDKTQFRAQYYNDPNDFGTASITPDMFQYYFPRNLQQELGRWNYRGSRLNVFAAVDFAYSLSRKADYTAIVVIGVDQAHNYYVLDVDRFKTTKISEYFDHILRLHTKWGFRKLRAECTAAQSVIVETLKNDYVKVHGLALSIEDFRPTRHQGSKEERMEAVLQPRYANHQVWHYSGGNCSLLEEELLLQNPAHDDIKDCLSAVIETAVPPTVSRASNKERTFVSYHPRFGGCN